jgi:hypothetical protein
MSTNRATDPLRYRQDFQFFPPKLAELQERELAVYKVCITLSDFVTS